MVETVNKNDGPIAIAILIVSIIGASIGLYYYFRRSGSKAGVRNLDVFTPPEERDIYIEEKERLKVSIPADKEKLKKLLMRRAIKTIPIVLQLQEEGQSVERLYQKGMLTDDVFNQTKEVKAFVDQEFKDICQEADELAEGWSKAIWPQAMQFYKMVRDEIDSKDSAAEKLEDQKRKAANEKKREKAKARKTVKDLAPRGEDAKASDLDLVTDVEEIQTMDSERMAKQLLEEEERARVGKRAKADKKGKK